MPILATQTLDLIASSMLADQGNRFRELERELLPLMEDAYSQEDGKGFRSHLGASLLGRDCARQIWYSWRWAKEAQHEARILRLFNRGHLEEARFVAMLLSIGVTVWQFDDKGNQFRVSGYKKHYGGGLDCVLQGIPELPGIAILGEFKTHNDKSFAKLLSTGVEDSKPEHYVQMNLYMGHYNLPYALYLAVNKNDDTIYGEIIPFHKNTFDRYTQRGVMIIDSDEAPPRISESAAWYKCRFCDHKDICHSTELPAKNCRTCRWVTAIEDAQWICENPLHLKTLSKEDQLTGCSDYVVNPTIKGKV